MERDKINTIKGDAIDMADEAKHRVAAGAEKVKRGLAGEEMPLGDRIASHVKEAGHAIAADVDRAKRDR